MNCEKWFNKKNDNENTEKDNLPCLVEENVNGKTRLIDVNGKFYNEISFYDAQKLAKINNLDLVCFNEKSVDTLPLCKILDFGKWKYHNEKTKKKLEKTQRHETKTIRFSHVIATHDITYKIRHIKEFLEKGDSVVLEMFVPRKDKQIVVANNKMDEILGMCNFAKELSRKMSDSLIIVQLAKK